MLARASRRACSAASSAPIRYRHTSAANGLTLQSHLTASVKQRQRFNVCITYSPKRAFMTLPSFLVPPVVFLGLLTALWSYKIA